MTRTEEQVRSDLGTLEKIVVRDAIRLYVLNERIQGLKAEKGELQKQLREGPATISGQPNTERSRWPMTVDELARTKLVTIAGAEEEKPTEGEQAEPAAPDTEPTGRPGQELLELKRKIESLEQERHEQLEPKVAELGEIERMLDVGGKDPGGQVYAAVAALHVKFLKLLGKEQELEDIRKELDTAKGEEGSGGIPRALKRMQREHTVAMDRKRELEEVYELVGEPGWVAGPGDTLRAVQETVDALHKAKAELAEGKETAAV